MAIKIGKDGSITRDGKTYKNKAAYKNRDKSKEGAKSSFFEKFIEGSKSKKAKAAKAKMYAAESMFKSAKNRDDAKVRPGKAQPFSSAFKSAKSAGKDKFLWKGKSYHTKTKSELEAGRKDLTKNVPGGDILKLKDKKESIFSKFKSSKTGSEFFKKLKKKK